MSRWINIDDDRNCYCGMDGEYENWNIDPNVLEEAQSNTSYKLGWQDAESQWIPCSERLPDNHGWYICSIKDGRVHSLYYANRLGWIDNVRKYMFELYDIRSKLTGTEVTPDQEAVDWNDWVTAWMPLPIPYKENKNEN